MKIRYVTALSGGVGGARLLDGLQEVLPAGALTAVVNTGDDFTHWGLHISPDLDTVMYTLSGLAHEERGWGLAEESFATLSMVRRYGGEDWFALGDRDLATHLLRTQALLAGEPLWRITARLCQAVGVRARVLPMADLPCRTMIEVAADSVAGPVQGIVQRSFQDWFVRLRAQPPVKRVWFDGCPAPAEGVLLAIAEADVVIIGPSNPYVSIDPILSLPGVREALSRRPVVAVSPIVGGQAIKGPLGTMIPQLTGRPASAAAIAAHYQLLPAAQGLPAGQGGPAGQGFLAGLVVERGDEAGIRSLPLCATDTVMRDRGDRQRLAGEVLRFAESLL